MYDPRLRQLKSLQTPVHGPSNEALERGLLKLRATMAAHPLKIAAPPEASWWASPFVWKPATALALALVVVGSSGLAVSAIGHVPKQRMSPVDSTSATEPQAASPKKRLETLGPVSDIVTHVAWEDNKEEEDHIDVEAPDVAAPVIHQPRLIASGESRSWKKAENKIEEASVR
jgi:hypothetical protein